MIDPQYICSGLLKIYLGSQEAACFYVNEEAGLFGILLFFSNVSPDNVIEAGEQEHNIHIPPSPGSLVSLVAWHCCHSCSELRPSPRTLCGNSGGSCDSPAKSWCCPASPPCRNSVGEISFPAGSFPSHPSPPVGHMSAFSEDDFAETRKAAVWWGFNVFFLQRQIWTLQKVENRAMILARGLPRRWQSFPGVSPALLSWCDR